jgi:hypothetical protein
MKFSIGDKVILKNTGEEGHVTAYINDQMIEVEVNGTSFPVYIDDIDHPYLKWFTDKKKPKVNTSPPEQLPVETEKFRKPRLAKGVYLSFLPVFKLNEMEDIVDYFKVYLLNELPRHIKYSYDVQLDQKSLFRHNGTLHEFGHVYLHNISFEDISSQPRFNWQLTDLADRQLETARDTLRIRPQKLFTHINDVLQKNEPTFSYLLIEDFAIKQKPEIPEKFELAGKPEFINTKTLSKAEPSKYELDLHIEKLVEHHRGLSNAEIVQIQLDTLEHYLNLAILHRQDRMIIIHGLGKGTLRDEVHKVLKQTPEVSRFKNEWSGRYGFGATEVQFKY